MIFFFLFYKTCDFFFFVKIFTCTFSHACFLEANCEMQLKKIEEKYMNFFALWKKQQFGPLLFLKKILGTLKNKIFLSIYDLKL